MSVKVKSLQERLINIVRRFPGRRILVVGDSVADQAIYGAITRVSREAPVFILRHEHTETVPGGAANCAMNLATLGANASLVGVAGDDEPGRAVVEKLKTARVDCSAFLNHKGLRTTTKVRILAGQAHSTRQQVIRIDYDSEPLHDPELRKRIDERALQRVAEADAVIVSDYDYGVVNTQLASAILAAANRLKVPVLADSRHNLRNLAGFTSATPNQDEVEQLFDMKSSNPADLETAGEELRKQLAYRALLVTRGSQGMMLLEDGVKPVHLDAIGARDPLDVTGAGDTVMAAYTLALASGGSFSDAARIANYAGGLVVMKRGTATVTNNELENSILHSDFS